MAVITAYRIHLHLASISLKEMISKGTWKIRMHKNSKTASIETRSTLTGYIRYGWIGCVPGAAPWRRWEKWRTWRFILYICYLEAPFLKISQTFPFWREHSKLQATCELSWGCHQWRLGEFAATRNSHFTGGFGSWKSWANEALQGCWGGTFYC